MVVHECAIAIDPGITKTGLFKAKLELDESDWKVTPFGVELIKNSTKYNERYISVMTSKKVNWMYGQIVEHIEDMGGEPIIFMEIPTGGSKDANSARALTCMIALHGILSYHYRVITVTPYDVKKVTGMKMASKGDMVNWATAKHGDLPGWKVGNRANANNAQDSEGKYYTIDMEHPADAVASLYAGLETKAFNDLHCDLFIEASYRT